MKKTSLLRVLAQKSVEKWKISVSVACARTAKVAESRGFPKSIENRVSLPTRVESGLMA